MKAIVKRYSALLTMCMMLFHTLIPFQVSAASSDELIFPLKEISKLECRFQEFSELSSGCKQALPILSPDDYSKYANQNGGYNDFTRIYTVLWGSSYKYGWDVGNGGHQGTDFATAKGTPVYTIADGTVIESGSDMSWGNYVSIEHTIKGKKIISNYAHLSKRNVGKGEKVKVGEKIGEVGSTGNSTGNHLHFQIDLPSIFHPYYYDWNACPYSYYQITEEGVCFDELNKHTFDPLVFLESNGGILDEISINNSNNTSASNNSSSKSSVNNNIFNTTVYYGYGSSSDVKEVQKIYDELGYYNGKISGDFEDIEDTIIDYQIATGVIKNKTDDGAGWFGPKTRSQTKADYTTYLASGNQKTSVTTQTKTSQVKKQEVEKVSRVNLMTREEREAQEMEEFLDTYKIDFKNTISQISKDELKTTILRIENKKGKGYKGNTPGNVTFNYDKNVISVFPESFYNFKNGEREISITGKKSGHTKITIKIGEVIVKTLSVSVGQAGEKPTASSAVIHMGEESVIGEKNTGFILMKDQYNNALVKSEFAGEFGLSADEDIQYCIKKGRLQDIKAIYKRDCFPEEYTDTLNYSYDDTIAGLLIFDYKILSNRDVTMQLLTNGSTLASANIEMKIPKGLAQSYNYYNEVVETLTAGISDGVNKGYFLENRLLSGDDALAWITNAAKKTHSDISDFSKDEYKQKQSLTREEFLELTHKYIGNNTISSGGQDYKDMKGENEVLVASLLGDSYNWKDNFGQEYFQPDKEITRGEAAYLLVSALETQGYGALVRK